MDTIDVQSLPPNFGRPHVFILGAGASRAAFPQGNKFGIQVPLMDDLIEILDLEPLLGKYDIELPDSNFEALYSTLETTGEHPEFMQKLEQQVFDYFADLRLPDEPTLYDYLVLSLRPKDLIATFNWDPFLWQALCRNAVGLGCDALPMAVHLHGNVAVGYCTKHTPISQGSRGNKCRHCGARLERSRLLYPVTNKNYTDDAGIAVSWQLIQKYLKDAFMLTIFGYGAPVTDVEAVKLMNPAWASRSDSVFHDVEIIDARDEDDLIKNWASFIYSHYWQVYSTFKDSMAIQYPRRTGETMCAQNLDCQFVRGYTPPVDTSLPKLWEWYKPLISQEHT